MKIVTTRTGKPAVWEEGGGWSNTGYATVVAGPDGQALRPIYIRRKGSLACRQHALMPVGPGVFVVEAGQHRLDYEVRVYRVDEQLQPVRICNYGDGEWDREPPSVLAAAIEAAKAKAACYHCREAHYVAEAASP